MSVSSATKNLQAVRTALNTLFVEREPVIDGMLTALLAGEHVLMLGPPGTAKSALARAFSEAVAGNGLGSFFQWLLTKFSTPEELFGPISLTGMKNDKYERVTKFKLPEARIAFLDEIWKANSSILNSLLTALNEGLFYNGDKVMDMPLLTCIGASNEYPEDASLDALYDRFMLRYWVDYISDRDALKGLLMAANTFDVQAGLEAGDYESLCNQVEKVKFNGSQTDTLLNIKAAIAEENFTVSDRTWIKAVRLLKARAVLNGRKAVEPSDFMLLADALWDTHEDRPKLVEIIARTADPYGSRAQAISDAIKTALRDLPDFTMLQNDTLTKFEFMSKIAPVDKKIKALAQKVAEMESEVADNAAVAGVRTSVDAAFDTVKDFVKKAADYEG